MVSATFASDQSILDCPHGPGAAHVSLVIFKSPYAASATAVERRHREGSIPDSFIISPRSRVILQ
jgi:hypothetical protein